MIFAPDNFVELYGFLRELQDGGGFSKKRFAALHDQVEETFRLAVNAAWLDGHPGWCLCRGRQATELYLRRNWLRGESQKDEAARLTELIGQMERDFFPSEVYEVEMGNLKSILRRLESADHFISKVMGDEQLLILDAGCSHRSFDALCRPFVYQDGAFSCDIYLFHRQLGETAPQESILLHELGHVLDVRLTGDVAVVPEDFLELGEYFFPGLSTTYREQAPEVFADCFSMGIASRPEFRQFDAFPGIKLEYKQIFDLYMRARLDALP